MELLNGKAKELFLEYYWQTKIKPLPMTICKREDLAEFFETVAELFQHALIIEWLDSVGVFISINREISYDNLWSYDITFSDNLKCISTEKWSETRQEATTEAIKKSLELINK